MKYPVYRFKCLSTGTLWMGVTRNLGNRLKTLQEGGPGRRLINPELLHVEQHDDRDGAHRRLQAIRRCWHPNSVWPSFRFAEHPPLSAALIGSSSLH